MTRYFLGLTLLGLLAGCAAPQNRVTSYHDNLGGQTDMLVDNELPSPPQPREVIWLNAYRVLKGSQRIYYFEVRYLATAEVGWLEIEPGQSLTLTGDGQPFKFVSASGSANTRELARKKAFAQETALFEVTKDQLLKLAKASQIKVQVKGTKGLVERDFGPKNTADFRAFVTRYAL